MTIPADTSPEVCSESLDHRHRQARIARLAACLVLGWMFLPLFNGRFYVCDDLLNYHLPIRQFYSDCLVHGDAFDWMPSLFSGFFLTGSGQAGTYHPWHWLLYRWLPLQTAFNLEILSSYPFMLLGMKLFLQRHLRRPDAAWLGAIVFTFSGFCTLHFLHPNAISVIAHLPWLLLAHDIVIRRDRAGPGKIIVAEAGVALLTGSQLLLGYPQYVWFSLLAEIVYCLGFVSVPSRGLRVLLLLSSLKALGLGLGAIQILPSLAALAESDRTLLPAEYFFQHPLTAPDMLQWLNPFLTKSRVFGINTHELGLYCGAIPILLACVAICRIRDAAPDRRLVQVMLLMGLIALWLSFGRAGGLYVVQTWLPLVGKFRWPSRIIMLMHFVVAVLAAVGYLKLTARNQKSSQLPPFIFLVPCFSAAASLLVSIFYFRELKAPWTLMIIGPVLSALAVVMLRDLARGKHSTAFMLFIAGDLAAYGFTYEALNSTQTMPQIIASLQPPPGSPANGRIIVETHLSDNNPAFSGNKLLLTGWQQADGYEGLLPPNHLLGSNISIDGLRISGVRWIVNAGHHSKIAGLIPTVDDHWLEVPDPWPRVRLTKRTRTILNASEAVKRLTAEGPVLVDRELPDINGNPSPMDNVRLALDRPGNIAVEVRSSSTQLLVLSERFATDWKATIDGQPTLILKAEVDYMGVLVTKGPHLIHFSFAPVSVQNGRLVSFFAGVLLLTYILVRRQVLRFASPLV